MRLVKCNGLCTGGVTHGHSVGSFAINTTVGILGFLNPAEKLGLKPNEALDHPWINKALEKAQQKVESRNFEIRKTLLQFDDVMNDQRNVIYEQRYKILSDKNIYNVIDEINSEIMDENIKSTNDDTNKEIQIAKLNRFLK